MLGQDFPAKCQALTRHVMTEGSMMSRISLPKNTTIVGALPVCLALAACASQPEKIPAQSVSTLPYQNYDCDQVGLEIDRVNDRAAALQASLEDEADADAAQMAIGLVLFWPALLFLEGGDGPEAQEYARLRGERQALETVAIQKNCEAAIAAAKFDQTVADDAKTCVAESRSTATDIDWAKVKACDEARTATQ
ncbi:MAG: hypothetical protein WD673_08600 [Alphaproteobacteria bacterium]